MRKDVKIVMGVCAVLLALLIVYALFVPGEKKGNQITQNTGAENATGQSSAAGQGDVSLAPSTQPADNNVEVGEATTQPTDPFASRTPTTSPADNTAIASGNAGNTSNTASGSGADWGRLLATGQYASAQMPASPAGPVSNTNNTSASMLETSAVPSPTPSLTSSSAQRTYTVKLGDTLVSIAQAEYGNGQLYTKILAANPKLSPRHMHVGQQIVIPDAKSVTAAGNHAERESATSTNGPHYTVQSGDNLQRIALKLYGSTGQWQKIYELNKSKIGSNPAHIHVGMVLALPAAPKNATAATAR